MSSEAAEAVAAMIASRAEERKAAFERQQAADAGMVEAKAEFAERRQHGLRARYKLKLARRAA